MKIHVLGVGCARCQELTRNTEQALRELRLDADIENLTAIE